MMTRETVGDEDCLYLNVYTVDIVKKRPVMVWIHGGAFSMGSGDATLFGPDYIVRKDVVLVTLNYRVGVLGTLHMLTRYEIIVQHLRLVIFFQKECDYF